MNGGNLRLYKAALRENGGCFAMVSQVRRLVGNLAVSGY